MYVNVTNLIQFSRFLNPSWYSLIHCVPMNKYKYNKNTREIVTFMAQELKKKFKFEAGI